MEQNCKWGWGWILRKVAKRSSANPLPPLQIPGSAYAIIYCVLPKRTFTEIEI